MDLNVSCGVLSHKFMILQLPHSLEEDTLYFMKNRSMTDTENERPPQLAARSAPSSDHLRSGELPSRSFL